MNKKLDTLFLIIAGALFAVFIMNILAGKAALFFDNKPIISLGDVGEFLVLFAAVVFFVIEVLRREAQKSDAGTKAGSKEEQETQ